MKKSFLLSGALLLSLSAFMANAQQLPNVGFDSWKTTCGSSRSVNEKKEVVRPGVEPAEWNGSNVDQTVFGVNKLEPGLVTKQEEGGNKYLQLRNMYVGALGIGSNAPGFINFGTPWVYATSQIKKCDGGTFGGQSFTYKPDAIKGKYKRADSDAEGKPISNNESSHIIVYLWYGTYQSFIGSTDLKTKEEKENVDRAVLGKTTGPISGKLVASCDKAFSSTANNDWETIVVPLNYEANAGNPAMMLISNRGFWYMATLCLMFYAGVFPFLKFATKLMVFKYGVDENMAGLIPAMLPFGTIFLTPLFGYVYDKFGKGATLMIIGSALLTIVHIIFVLPITSYIVAIAAMIALGVAFGLVPSAMWPSVPKIIPMKLLGSAYAMIFYIQNIGLALVPVWIGKVNQANTLANGSIDYTETMTIFAAFGAIAVIISLLLFFENKKKGYGLEEPNIQ